MKKARVGIIGCGRIGALLEADVLRDKPCTHAGGFNSIKSAEIVAGCDIDSKRLLQFGKNFSVTSLYEDYISMLKNEKLDVVSIATWTPLHAQMTIDASRFGVKGIFCEKPIATNLIDAKKMIDRCRRKNITLTINHERRWDPCYEQAKKIIDKGKIGEIRTVIGNVLSWSPGRHSVKDHGGGALFHDGTHMMDLMLYFGGPVNWVSGAESRSHGKKNIEDTALGLFQFKSGAWGVIEGGGRRNYFNFELDIQGSEGRIVIGNGGQKLYLTKKSQRFTSFKELEEVPFPKVKVRENAFIRGPRDLLRSISKQTESRSTGVDGYRALQLILAVYESASNGGIRINIR